MGDTSIRERIKEDFELDLPIGDGSASNREDPLVILASDPDEVALTQMLLLRCLGKAFGRLWRFHARIALDGPLCNVERVTIDAKTLTPTEIISERLNYYFDVSALLAGREPGSHGALRTAVSGYFDRASGIFFPQEIGWMHLDGVTDDEPAHPGLGRSIAYSAMGCKATVYVYSGNARPFPEGFDREFLEHEFGAPKADIINLSPDAQPAGDRVLRTSKEGTSYFRQDFEIGDDHSVLALTMARRHFVKARLTWAAEELFYDIGDEFIDAVFDLAAPRTSRAH